MKNKERIYLELENNLIINAKIHISCLDCKHKSLIVDNFNGEFCNDLTANYTNNLY